MSGKTYSFSVRVSPQDAEFIAGLDVPGANSPSDKLRALIANARERSANQQTYQGAYKNITNLCGPSLMQIKTLEHQIGEHSELVEKVVNWAQDIIASFNSSISAEIKSEKQLAELKQLEATVANKTLGLTEDVLRMATTPNCRCYNPKIVSDSIGGVLEVANVILKTK